MFEYTEYSINDEITKLELLKPNGQSLGEIINATKKVSTFKLGSVSELTFTLPDTELFSNVMLSRDNVTGTLLELNVDETLNNNQAQNTLVRYLVRATYSNGNQIIFILPNKDISSDISTTSLNVTCYSREYELSNSIIINYIGVPINNEYVLDGLSLEEVLRDIMQDTLWDIDFLDEGFNSSDAAPIRRTVEAFNNISVLAVVDNLMGVFGGIPEYDTINRKISVYKPDNKEIYKFNGLEINDYNYLKDINQQESTDNLITRLYGLGKDGLTINAISPTGTSYLEDFSFFLYPAEMNTENELIKSSNYMTDELALAELIYEKFLLDVTGLLNDLFTEQAEKQVELTGLTNELSTLNTELKLIQDRIDLKVGLNQANNENAEYVEILAEFDAKNVEIENKTNEISDKQVEIQTIIDQINNIYDSLKLENHFTPELLKERQLYVYEGLYTNTGIAIENDLYDEMLEFLKANNTPTITVSMSASDIFSMQSRQAKIDRDRIKLGELINIYYKKGILEIDIQAQIMEVKISEDDHKMELVISNVLDYKRNSEEWLSKILQRNITTSTIVENNRVDWEQGKIAYDDITKIYQEGIDAALIEVNSAVNNTVKTNERGITVTDTTNPLRFVRITNGVMALSKDGGRTFATAISADGVWAEKLVGQMLIGNELQIIGDNGTLTIGDIEWDAFEDINKDDFGIVIKNDKNAIFLTRERGFKITNTRGNVTYFYADTEGKIIANELTVVDGNFTGSINSVLGNIGGFEITEKSLRTISKKAGISSNDELTKAAFWAGGIDPNENTDWATNLPFYVRNDGYLKASNANISGNLTALSGKIADYTITGQTLVGGNVGMSSTSGYGYAFWAGSNSSSSAPFRVGHDGSLFASSATITGYINANGGTFSGSIGSSATISGGTLTGSNINIGGTYGGTFLYRNGVGYINAGYISNHPWMSAINVSSSRGIYFYTGDTYGDIGSYKGHIDMVNSFIQTSHGFKVNGNLTVSGGINHPTNAYINICDTLVGRGSDGISIIQSTNTGFARIRFGNAIYLVGGNNGTNTVYAQGSGLSNGRILTDEGSASSLNTKKDLVLFDENKYQMSLNLLENMNIYDYEYKYNLYQNKQQYGFIIDELEKLDESKLFFDFREEKAVIENDKINFYEDEEENPFEGEKIVVKKYNPDTLDKYLLTVCKALLSKVNDLEKQIKGENK